MIGTLAQKIPNSFFRYTGIGIFVAAIAVWLAKGAHIGWTQTEVTVWLVDEITGIEYPEIHDELLAGLEFPAVGLIFLVGFLAIDLILTKLKATNKTNTL